MIVLLAGWQDFANASVSEGYVVALAVICLLQYFVHIYKMTLARRETESARRELDGVSRELQQAQRDRAATQYENQVLREFVSQGDSDRALRLLMRRFVPNSDDGFAAFLGRHDDGLILLQSHGLSDASSRNLCVDDGLLARLAQGETIVFQGVDLRASRLWSELASRDRIKVRRLFLLPIGGPGELLGTLVSTDLGPANIDTEQQVEIAQRVLGSVARNLRDKLQLESQQDQLRSSADMLALRSIADRPFDTPVQMIEEFVRQAAIKASADRAALFLFAQDSATPFKSLVRCGDALPAGVRDQWQRFEETLASVGIVLGQPEEYSHEELERLRIDTLIGTALLIPILQQNAAIGVLCFTRRLRERFGSHERKLAAWTGSALAEMIPRIVNQASVERQARVDSLTQLANRSSFDRQIAQELRLAQSSGSVCSLMLLDLDRFKAINDNYGHRGGDEVLRAASRLIRDSIQNIRSGDRALGAVPFVARYGGEEIAVIFPRLGCDAARRIGESVRLCLESQPVEFEGSKIPVTTSIGLATFPQHGETVDDLIAAADAALYQAKATGRNRLAVPETAEAFAFAG